MLRSVLIYRDRVVRGTGIEDDDVVSHPPPVRPEAGVGSE